MKLQPVTDDLFRYLLAHASGARFEQFSKQVFAAEFGEAFCPLGGLHDGGADGVLSSYIQELRGKPNTYVQFTTTTGTSAKRKMHDTIAALRKCGREPRQLIYATSEALPKCDVLVQEIFEKDSILVTVRDLERLKGYVNNNTKANAAFYEFFSGEITSLSKAANLCLPSVGEFAKDPTVYVFLNHELRNRFTNDKLNIRVLDALIYWSLRDTDPDQGVFLSRSAIAASIQAAFPVAKGILVSHLNNRLEVLSKREAGGAERLRHYRANDSFCLPFEMRKALAIDASDALLQQSRFQESIQRRMTDESNAEISGDSLSLCCELVFSTVHRYFIEQGLLLAAFLEGKLDKIQISDQIVEDIMVTALAEIEHRASLSPAMFEACLAALRGIFYRSNADERAYMVYLSRTSCLLVTMQSAPKLLEYFNQMGGNFRLIVGTDLLIKTISERHLEATHRQVTNLLLVAKRMGSELILTEPVVTEVFTHLHASDLEFRNHYAEREPFLKDAERAACDRILIRAYLHARSIPGGPNSWREYVHQLTDPDGLRTKSEGAKQALQGLMTQQFGMTYLSMEDLRQSVPLDKVEELAARLDGARHMKHAELSFNDALLTYAVYSQRACNGESAIYDGFGFRTWWLTKETTVLGLTGMLVHAQGGVPYIMRPEFLLNFVALAPKAAEVRKSLVDLLPTTAGLQLGHHLSPEILKGLLQDAAEWTHLTPERVGVLLAQQMNLLCHARYKQYIEKLN